MDEQEKAFVVASIKLKIENDKEQHCAKYEPRARVHQVNKKKQYLTKIRKEEVK